MEQLRGGIPKYKGQEFLIFFYKKGLRGKNECYIFRCFLLFFALFLGGVQKIPFFFFKFKENIIGTLTFFVL